MTSPGTATVSIQPQGGWKGNVAMTYSTNGSAVTVSPTSETVSIPAHSTINRFVTLTDYSNQTGVVFDAVAVNAKDSTDYADACSGQFELDA
jgi:hypothetical protein